MRDLIVTEKLSVSVGYNGRLHSFGIYVYGAASPARKPGDLLRDELEISFPLRPIQRTTEIGVAWWRPQLILWFKDRKRFAWPSYARWPSERART
jgi:hypothetical protein